MPSFAAACESLDPKIQEQVVKALAYFSDHTADNSLRIQMKHGLENVWGFRVTKGYRVFYKKLRDKDGAVYCLFHVGHHDDYRALKTLSSRVTVSLTSSGSQTVKVSFTSGGGGQGKKSGKR